MQGMVDEGDAAARSEAFYGGALERIRRMLLVQSVVLTLAALLLFDWRVALGLLIGAGVSYLNLYWLKRVVAGLLDRVSPDAPREPGWTVVFRLLGRYAVVLLLAYGIFSGSGASLYGFLAGLFLPVAAMMCEAAYEAWMALRRGL